MQSHNVFKKMFIGPTGGLPDQAHKPFNTMVSIGAILDLVVGLPD